MNKKIKFPALSFADHERNARLYKYLTSLGLYTIPNFVSNSDDCIEYIIVTAAIPSNSSTQERANNTSSSCISAPMNSSKVINSSLSTQGFRNNVINFPTKP